jgi:hypothetical protein
MGPALVHSDHFRVMRRSVAEKPAAGEGPDIRIPSGLDLPVAFLLAESAGFHR